MPFKITHLPLASTKVNNEQGLRNLSGKPKIHDGIDLKAVEKTNVYATHSGKVIRVIKDSDTAFYGNTVVLEHEETGMLTLYAHLDSFNVTVGQVITEDQAKNGFVIAKSGNTGGGQSTGPHLHLEILNGQQIVNDGSGKTVLQTIKDSSSGLGIWGGGSINKPSAPRLNPRPFLANYAIETTMANLAAIEAINHPNQSSVFLGTYESLDVVNKNKVDDLSSEIFSKDIDLTDKITIDVEGDKRPNIITINKNGDERFNKQIKHLSGLDNNDIYKFEGKIFGQINIEDSNGTIILNNTKLENLKPTIVINETNQPTPLRLMKIGDKEYYLTRCDDKGNGYPTVIDYDYAVQRNLLIVPLGAADIRDSIMVRDFFSGDGKQAKDFGIIYDEDKLARIDFSNSNKADIIGREISSNTILLPNKNFIFTYNAIDGAVMAQIIDKAGNKIGSAIQIRDGSDITNNNIMPLSGGRFAIVNSVPNPINPNNNLQTYQLYIRTFDSDLSLVSNLKVTTEYDVISAGSENGSSPAFLYAIADDGLAVVYTKGFNVFQLQQFDKNGNKIGEEMPVHGAGSNYNVDSNTTKPFATISLHGLGKHQPISIYNKENSNIPDQWYVNNGKKYGKIYGNDGNLIAEIVSSAISEKSLNLPKIAEIKTNQIPLENNKKSAELEGDNDFTIAATNQAIYPIVDFRKNGDDTINIAALDQSGDEYARRLRFLQTTTNSSAVKVESSQIGSDTMNDNNKNYLNKKIMKKTLKTIIASILVLLITSVVAANEVKASFDPFKQYYLLQKYSKYVKKDQGGYKIYAENGKVTELKNEPYNDSDSYTEYFLESYLEDIGYFLFYIGYYEDYEGNAYALVNRNTGEILKMDNEPYLSPDKKKIASQGCKGSPCNHIIQIFYLLPDQIVKKTEITSFSDLSIHSWADSKTLRMKKLYDDNGKNYKVIYDEKEKNWVFKETNEKFPELLQNNSSNQDKEINKLLADKKAVLEIAKNYPEIIKRLPDNFRDDEDIVKIILEKEGYYIKHASDRLKNNKKIALIAIRNNPNSFEYISNNLKNDQEILLIKKKIQNFNN